MIAKSQTGPAAIHAIARKHPELSLIAAVIELAVRDAQAGDREALEWLGSDTCAWYCGHLAPDGVEPGNIQQLLIEEAR